MIKKFLTSNSTNYRLFRTIIQGIIGTIIAYIDILLGMFAIPDEIRPVIVAFVMAILSPIMGAFSDNNNEESLIKEE